MVAITLSSFVLTLGLTFVLTLGLTFVLTLGLTFVLTLGLTIYSWTQAKSGKYNSWTQAIFLDASQC